MQGAIRHGQQDRLIADSPTLRELHSRRTQGLNYTNHTVMPEVCGRWSEYFLERNRHMHLDGPASFASLWKIMTFGAPIDLQDFHSIYMGFGMVWYLGHPVWVSWLDYPAHCLDWTSSRDTQTLGSWSFWVCFFPPDLDPDYPADRSEIATLGSCQGGVGMWSLFWVGGTSCKTGLGQEGLKWRS